MFHFYLRGDGGHVLGAQVLRGVGKLKGPLPLILQGGVVLYC